MKKDGYVFYVFMHKNVIYFTLITKQQFTAFYHRYE